MSSSSSAHTTSGRSVIPGGNLDDERRPLPLLTEHADAAAMRLDDCLRDVQPEAGPLDLPLERGLRPEEPFEEPLAVCLRDPDACVGHFEPDHRCRRAE